MTPEFGREGASAAATGPTMINRCPRPRLFLLRLLIVLCLSFRDEPSVKP